MRPARRVVPAVPLLLVLLLFQSPAAQRLSAGVRPSRYTLAFDVDLARGVFTGRETIAIQLDRPTTRIVLHSAGLTLHEVFITSRGTRQNARVTFDEKEQTARFDVPRSIPGGAAELQIRYSGPLRTDLRGLYLSQAGGRNYAVTQLEATDARRMFPSFDEPALKATFDISVTIDRGDTAISNGRVLSDVPAGNNRHTLTFATTAKMSTYLVALAIGDFQCIGDSADGVPIRVCAVPGKQQMGRFALDWAKDILVFFHRYYSIKYPFEKLDMVAIPDFAAGAMENTGAIFYRDAALLTDPATASIAVQKDIANTVAHEIAHQWFGNLVTMRWWDDLWLNEGFATWMANRPLAALRPEWNVPVDEAGETREALQLDALHTTRPIHSSVETPDEIEESFDGIAYAKGAAVLRMIERFVGPDLFRRGINAYLEKYAYGNATSENFWTTVASATGKPVDRVLATFVNQPGAPLVEASLECRNSRSELALRQRRMPPATAGPAARPASDGIWQVPVCLKTSSPSAAVCQVLSRPAETLTAGTTCEPWVFINADAQGYFRTAYSRSMLQGLASALPSLTPAERSLLANDAWALVRIDRYDVADYLTLASGFSREQSAGVLSEITGRLRTISASIVTDATRPAFAAWVRNLLGPLYAELGIDRQPGDSDERRQIRSIVIDALGTIGDDDSVMRAARQALDAALANPGAPGRQLDGTSADAIVRVAARRADGALYDRLRAAVKTAVTPEEQYRYLFALTSFEDPALSQLAIEHMLSPELRGQDVPVFISRLLGNPAVNLRAWNFMKERWGELQKRAASAFGVQAIAGAVGSFCTPGERDDVREFFRTHPAPSAARTIQQSLERIDACIAMRAKQAPILEAWLKASASL